MYCVATPAAVTANVPLVVTGLPLTENAAGIDRSTDVTVPVGIAGNGVGVPNPSR